MRIELRDLDKNILQLAMLVELLVYRRVFINIGTQRTENQFFERFSEMQKNEFRSRIVEREWLSAVQLFDEPQMPLNAGETFPIFQNVVVDGFLLHFLTLSAVGLLRVARYPQHCLHLRAGRGAPARCGYDHAWYTCLCAVSKPDQNPIPRNDSGEEQAPRLLERVSERETE